jgi:hypothetical protein
MVFVELIAEYADGEKLDVFINPSQIIYMRRHEQNDSHTIIVFCHPEAERLLILEPIEEVRRKCRDAGVGSPA